MQRKWIGITLVIAVIAIPITLKSLRSEAAKEVEIEAIEARTLKASILASGNLVYREQAQLSPEVIGKVTALLVKEGDKVTKDQIVLRLDEEVYKAEVASQEAAVRQQRINIERLSLNVSNQERQFKRSAELHARKLLGETQFEEARHARDIASVELRASREALQQAEAMLVQARERLAKTAIRAPISGTVTAVDIKVGETAVSSAMGIAGSSLMTIANTDSIMSEANVDEADIAGVKIGQEVIINAAAYPDKPLKGTVEAIPLSPKKTDAMTQAGSGSLARNYSVKIRLEPLSDVQLRPGMTCRAEIFTTSGAKALAIPIQAVFNDSSEDSAKPQQQSSAEASRQYVFIDKDGKAEKRSVKTGLSDDSYQEIVNGLKAGERVVTGPYKLLRQLQAGDALKALPKAAP